MGERSRGPTQRLGGGKGEGRGEDKGGKGKGGTSLGLALRRECFRESSSKWET